MWYISTYIHRKKGERRTAVHDPPIYEHKRYVRMIISGPWGIYANRLGLGRPPGTGTGTCIKADKVEVGRPTTYGKYLQAGGIKIEMLHRTVRKSHPGTISVGEGRVGGPVDQPWRTLFRQNVAGARITS
jgi:hypothetical protein